MNSFNFFKDGEIFSKKCYKWQNIPNMKTKIFSYPSIVLATYGKPNSEVGWFSHFWPLKPWKKNSISIFKISFQKKWSSKKKGFSYLPTFWPFLFSGLDMGPFLLFLVVPLFWVLCLNKVWHGLITWLNRVQMDAFYLTLELLSSMKDDSLIKFSKSMNILK
jgi:hypothetical protein